MKKISQYKQIRGSFIAPPLHNRSHRLSKPLLDQQLKVNLRGCCARNHKLLII